MTQSATNTPRIPSDRPEHGPHPGALAGTSLLLVLAGLAVSGALSGGEALSSPFGADAEVVGRINAHPDAYLTSAFFQFGAAVPLGIYAATVYARQLRLGVRVPGPVIGLVGGLVAVTSLLGSAAATWVLSRPEVTTDAALTRALAFLAFLAGGPGYVMGLGLLIAGLAVPALILRLLPRGLAAAGLVLAVLAELTWFALIVDPVQYLLPVGRFLGGLWLVLAGFLLPRRRPRRGGPDGEA